MKIYVNPMNGHTDRQVEEIIKEEVRNHFGEGGKNDRKYVVINENYYCGDEEDEDGGYLMFEGTLEECHTFSEICKGWFDEIVTIYSEEVFKGTMSDE